mgnify:FL=1
MTTKNFLKRLIAGSLCLATFLNTSCTKEQPTGGENTPTTSEELYVIAAQVDGTSYLITSETLEDGSVSVVGNGTEVIGGSYWVYKDMNYLFALVYNKGGAGTGASYYLNQNGTPTEQYLYDFNRITTYGTWGDNVITASTGDSNQADEEGNLAQALLFNYLNSNDGSQKNESIIAENFLGNGENVSFAGFTESGGKLYTSVIPMGMSKYGIGQWPELVSDPELIAQADGGSGSGAYIQGEIPSTQYPDSAYIAIYSGDNFNSDPIIVRTGKMGYGCGRMRSQYYQTIWSADNGDVYLFSSGYGRTATSSEDLKKVTGTLPSSVMRIKKGATDFDPDYFVNFEEIGNNKPMFRCWHIDQNNFLLQLYKDGVEGMFDGQDADVSELAIFNAEEKTITTVTGLPADLAGFSGTPYGENGAAYIAVTVTSGEKPAFYKIDVTTAEASKALTVDAESISAVGKLKVRK